MRFSMIIRRKSINLYWLNPDKNLLTNDNYALSQVLKLLGYIDKNEAFSESHHIKKWQGQGHSHFNFGRNL